MDAKDCTCCCHNQLHKTIDHLCKCIPYCEHCSPLEIEYCTDIDCPFYVVSGGHERSMTGCKYA